MSRTGHSDTREVVGSDDALFNPTEEHCMLRELVADFTTREVEPQASEYDEKGKMNVSLFRKLGELGLLGITVPTEIGRAHV